ncbi:MAG: hypothetical protein U0263_05030 [Polyangiaceae bacterium]
MTKPLTTFGASAAILAALMACKSKEQASPPAPVSAAPPVATNAPNADPEDYSGVFSVSGDRTGTITITRYRGAQYRVNRSEGGSKQGVGHRVGKVLFVAWSVKGAGLHLFEKSGGELKGSVFGSQEMKIGNEGLSGKANDDFTGKFKLDAEYPPGDRYKGSLTVTQKDGILKAAYYTVTSDGDEGSYVAYGLVRGDAAAVGSHAGDPFEFAAYEPSADRRTYTGKVLASDQISKGTWSETLTFKSLP